MDTADSAASESGPRNLRALELAATVLIAIAAILTAWAAFQHAKWNGVQADASRRAAAVGLEASQATTVANAARSVDVATFLSWLQAVQHDIDAGALDRARPYMDSPDTLSGFISLRFRDEFRTGFDAWIATRPLVNREAPATPFEMPDYKLEADEAVKGATAEAEIWAEKAREANHRGENYVLLTVLFAMGLVFASIGSKLTQEVARASVLGLAALILLGAVVALATFPVEI
jgi:hypothetical protein